MFLKPKTTQRNPKAHLYKRFNDTHTATTTLTEDSTTYDITLGQYANSNYRYVDSFDFKIVSDIKTTEVQYIKGLMVEEISFDIEYYSDRVGMLHNEDILVIVGLNGNHAYIVEDPDKTQKRFPKPFNIYRASLKSIK